MKGWIKLHRQIKNNWLWEDPIKLKRWITMLLEVNYTEGKMNLGNQLIKVNRGSSTNALRTWAELLKCGTKATTNFFDLLESDGMITRETLGSGKHSTTLIKITNYEQYQTDQETLTESLTTTLNDTKERHERHTIKERKEGKELKKLKEERAFHPPSVNDVFNEMINNGLITSQAEKESQGFINYYKSVGWRIGTNKEMANWQASVQSWITRMPDFNSKSKNNPQNGNNKPTINRQTTDTINQNLQGWEIE